MGYVESNLLDNESIIYKGKIHDFYIFVMWIGVFLWLLLFILWVFSKTEIWALWLFIIVVFLYKLFFFLTIEIVLTNKRILYKTGIIARQVFELQLNKVESARLDQTIFERIIWAWTLVISWTWWHGKPMENLSKPLDIRTLIYQQIEVNIVN